MVALLSVLASVPLPLLMPLLVDEVLLNQPAFVVNSLNALFPTTWHGPVLYILSILLLSMILRLLALGFGVWQMRQFTLVSKQLVFQLREQLVNRLKHVSMQAYETLGSGKINAHLVTDLDTLDDFIGNSVSKLIIAVLTIIGTSCVLFWMHWQLALFILCLNPLVIYFTMLLGKKVKNLKKQENTAYALFQETLTETLDAIQQIRAYNREEYYLNRVIKAAQGIQTHSAAHTWQTDAANRLSFTIFLLGFDGFRAVGMLMVVFSDLSIGSMMAVFGYLWFILAPIQEVLNIQYAYHSASAALQRINSLFDLKWEKQYPANRNPFTQYDTVSIRLENIDFAYEKNQNGSENWILHNTQLHIKAGEKVAFVSGSGSGKTTLVQILLGLYTPQRGTIYYGDMPVEQIGWQTVRDNVATVLQQSAMFNDSLRMNLTLGKACSDVAIWQALEIAQLDTFVQDLKAGLNTILGQHGMRLSGGQRQRVAIARMVLANPKVVILDEATSALDIATESRLHKALDAYLKDKTTIIITHRLSATEQADRIISRL
jgi:ATP-binding cassette subfamily C protein